VAAQLTNLIKKGQPEKLKWEETQNRASETFKAHISCPPVLRLPYFSREFVLLFYSGFTPVPVMAAVFSFTCFENFV